MPFDSQVSHAPTRRSERFDSSRMHMMIAASRPVRTFTIGLLARLELAFLSGHKDREVLRTINGVRRQRESLLSGNEAFTVFSLARGQAALPGCMAEVGVYQGCSARLISLASGGVALHLFDTFAGLPQPEKHELDRMRQGHYAASLDGVREFLADRPDVSYHPGTFPDTVAACADRRFSFVHLDVDLKAGTRACLDFFYPRLVPGGIVLTHDYSYLSGVRDAFDEFLVGRPERVLELPSSQAMLVKQ